MKKNSKTEYEMPAETNFSKLQRIPNPFSQKFQELNLISLDSDVKAAFPDSQAVNSALRELLEARKGTFSAKADVRTKAA